jgi:hypothetical protein
MTAHFNINGSRFRLPEEAYMHLKMDELEFVLLKSKTACQQGFRWFPFKLFVWPGFISKLS